MRRPHVMTASFAVVLLATGCGAAAQQVSNHHPAVEEHSRAAPAQGAEVAKPQSGRGVPSSGGLRQGNGILPPLRCSFPRAGAEPDGPLPCTPMLLLKIVLHPRNGPPRIIYVRKPCLCVSGG